MTETEGLIGRAAIPMVGIGGSAGAIGALRDFFQVMPSDSGMSFVVVMHLHPDHESTLAELLQRETAMRVEQVLGPVKVAANRVYVIPPGMVLEAQNGTLDIAEMSEEPGQRHTVDLFFRTLAESHGPLAAAVVLSGMDGDGAVGVRRIKEMGGLTIAQDPSEAEHPSMPNSAIRTGVIDWVLPVAELPARLANYFDIQRRLQLPPEEEPTRSSSSDTVKDDEYYLREILTFVRTRSGRDFTYYKRATILRRIARRLRVNGFGDLASYLAFLRTTPGESDALMKDLLISVTNFFRDRDAFAALELRLPQMFRGKGPSDVVRAWVPGCATGEEAYSIAIMLHEQARTIDAPPSIQIFATDLDADVVQFARDGLYPTAISADVSADRIKRYFIRDPQGGLRVRREIRELVLFAHHDLLRDSPFSRLDLVSCRNLLIYLKPGAQTRALDIFHFALMPSGILFLGSSETVNDESGLYTVLDKKYRLYARRSHRRTTLPIPVGQSVLSQDVESAWHSGDRPVVPSRAFQLFPQGQPSARHKPDEVSANWGEIHFQLIDRLAPPSVLVNANHDIVHASQKAGEFLQFTGGEPTRSLLRLLLPMLRIEVRAALYRVAQNAGITDTFDVPIDINGEHVTVNIRVSSANEVAQGYFLVVLEKRTASDPLSDNGLSTTRSATPDRAAQQLDREIERMKVQLRQTVEQFEVSEEELKASNEELQAMNEEMHAATEELETSREELQSINEELVTVNVELKSKVEELAASNSDVQNLMAATEIATVFLDRDMRITRYTPSALALFNFISGDVGRPFTDLQHRLQYPELAEDAEKVLRTLVPVDREVSAPGGKWYLAQLRPYRTTEDFIGGVVLTFVDITENRKSHEALEAGRRQLTDAMRETEEARDATEIIEAAGKAKDHFLAVLSHELRTPLTPVLMATHAMEMHPDFPESLRKYLAMIQRNLRTEARFIDDLLDVTRITSGKLRVVRQTMDIHPAIQSAIENSMDDITRRSQQVVVALDAEHHTIHGDFDRLQQAFWNLIKNASKFSPVDAEINIGTRSDDTHIFITVRDEGIGISPENQQRIFGAYTQADENVARQYGGLGLGLSITQATVSFHDGTVIAHSEGDGHGSTFIVTLPLLRPTDGEV